MNIKKAMKPSDSNHGKNEPEAVALVRSRDLQGLRDFVAAYPNRINIPTKYRGLTALHIAAASDLTDYAEVLLGSAECNPSILDAKGHSAATLALISGNRELADLIADHLSRWLERQPEGSMSAEEFRSTFVTPKPF